ncbi:hypothetical protein H4R35_005445 [Dimargaris xerosporica]|nr:hypothetical protein H4R35_005445 [Dimargaris xerosporica]
MTVAMEVTSLETKGKAKVYMPVAYAQSPDVAACLAIPPAKSIAAHAEPLRRPGPGRPPGSTNVKRDRESGALTAPGDRPTKRRTMAKAVDTAAGRDTDGQPSTWTGKSNKQLVYAARNASFARPRHQHQFGAAADGVAATTTPSAGLTDYHGQAGTLAAPQGDRQSLSPPGTPQSGDRPKRSAKTPTFYGKMTKKMLKPRWHTQMYIMFLALRQMPGHEAARSEIIKAAVELDKQISEERGLPRVFTGKTPMNSASACLTNNGDKYFIPFKPPGARSMHFRLSYVPCDFDEAVREYNRWNEVLVNQDWPICFGAKPGPEAAATGVSSTALGDRPSSDGSATTNAKAIAPPTGAPNTTHVSDTDLDTVPGTTAPVPPPATSPPADIESADRAQTSSLQAMTVDDATLTSPPSPSINDENPEKLPESMQAAGDMTPPVLSPGPIATTEAPLSAKPDTAQTALSPPSPPPPPTNPSFEPGQPLLAPDTCAVKPENHASPTTALEPAPPPLTEPIAAQPAADNSTDTLPPTVPSSATVPDPDIPKSWKDIVEVRPSTIPNAGNGLFAARDIPMYTPLGFYFGVPMTEDEFDSLKDHVGIASHYSIMYRRTVLDATDEQGQPFTDPNGPLYCPFHFMNESIGRGNVAFLEGHVVNQVICMTTKNVKAGQELFVYYGSEVDRDHWASKIPSRLA